MPQDFSFLSPDLQAEQQSAERRKRMADALLQQGVTPAQGQMAGRFYVAPSPLQGIAKLFQTYAGIKGSEQAEQQSADIMKRGQAARISALQALGENPDPQALVQSNDPMLQQAGMQALLQRMKPQEGFTLTPGAIRYGPDGRQVASAPFRQEGFTLTPGGVRFGPNGERLAELPDKPADQWSEPFDLNGATVQRNSRTGEVRTAVSRPPVTNVSTTVLPPQRTFDNENKLRDDYNAASKAFGGIRDAYNTINATLSGEITAPSTLAAATKFMKMLDPESVVRESELNMALKSTGMLDRFLNLHNVVMKGQVLTPNQVQEIKTIAERLYRTAEAQQGRTDEYFSGLAKSYGLDPTRVIRNQRAVTSGGNDRRSEPRQGSTVTVDY